MAKCRRVSLLLLVLFIILLCCATESVNRYMWIVVASMVGTLLIVDLLFLGDGKFIYDIFYHNWEKQVSPNY